MRHEYKVVELKQKTFIKGAMKASDLESIINEHARQGWILDKLLSGETFRFIGGGKDVILIVLRKDIQ